MFYTIYCSHCSSFYLQYPNSIVPFLLSICSTLYIALTILLSIFKILTPKSHFYFPYVLHYILLSLFFFLSSISQLHSPIFTFHMFYTIYCSHYSSFYLQNPNSEIPFLLSICSTLYIALTILLFIFNIQTP